MFIKEKHTRRPTKRTNDTRFTQRPKRTLYTAAFASAKHTRLPPKKEAEAKEHGARRGSENDSPPLDQHPGLQPVHLGTAEPVQTQRRASHAERALQPHLE